jgi:hypothetical protein
MTIARPPPLTPPPSFRSTPASTPSCARWGWLTTTSSRAQLDARTDARGEAHHNRQHAATQGALAGHRKPKNVACARPNGPPPSPLQLSTIHTVCCRRPHLLTPPPFLVFSPYMAEIAFVGSGPNVYQLWLGGSPNQARSHQHRPYCPARLPVSPAPACSPATRMLAPPHDAPPLAPPQRLTLAHMWQSPRPGGAHRRGHFFVQDAPDRA